MEKSRSYEGLFIVSSDKENEIDDIKKGIHAVISENSGNIVRDNVMGKRTFAYPIKKKTAGIYYEVAFTSLPGNVAKMLRQFRINTNILRTLIDKVEA
ncbi:MAG: 30S ribosomal protein S6 [Candidatus Omnitrophota bacterium]